MSAAALARHFADHRIGWSRLFLILTLIYALFGTPPQFMQGWLGGASELLGYAMLVTGCLWRVWCLTFIGGTKDGALTTVGPYSIVRNPLYVGSFLGVTGFAFAIKLPLLVVAFLILFLGLYPAVVAREEKRLEELFGDAYRRYCAATPRWIPRFSQYAEPQSISVSPAKIRQGILDAMWYLWAFAFVQVIEALHRNQLLPRLF